MSILRKGHVALSNLRVKGPNDHVLTFTYLETFPPQVLKLLHFLVKFGYYGDTSDIQKLQEPLLSLLDGKNDLPFVLDAEQTKKKGRTTF